MSNNCGDIRSRIPRALLGDLSPEEQQALLSHLSECPPCAQEQKLYLQTLQQLRSLSDVPPPHHFFVYPAESHGSPWLLFRQLSPAWKIAMAAGVMLVALLSLFVAANVQFRAEAGVYEGSFGRALEPKPAVATPAVDVDSLKADLVQILEARLRQENQEWIQALRGELSKFGASLTQRQQRLLQVTLNDLQTHVNDRILTTQTALQGSNEESLRHLYRLLHTERQQDLAMVTERLNRLALRGEISSNQTEAILSTLLDVAELKFKNQ